MGKMKGRVIAKSRNSISSRFHLEFRYRSSREKRVNKYRRANFGKSRKHKVMKVFVGTRGNVSVPKHVDVDGFSIDL